MGYTHRIVSGFDFIDLEDSLDLYSVPQLKEFCFKLIKNPETKRIMIVMENLEYIDSAGLGMLLNLAHTCKKSYIGFKLIKLSPAANKIFSFVKAHDSFDIYETEQEAIDSLVRSMSYNYKKIGDIDQVSLEGAIDLYCTPDIKKFMRNLLKNGSKKLIVSFSNVSFMDSSCLGMLTNLHFECQQQNIKFVLANPSRDAKKIFALTKMNQTFTIFDTLEEAVETLKQIE